MKEFENFTRSLNLWPVNRNINSQHREFNVFKSGLLLHQLALELSARVVGVWRNRQPSQQKNLVRFSWLHIYSFLCQVCRHHNFTFRSAQYLHSWAIIRKGCRNISITTKYADYMTDMNLDVPKVSRHPLLTFNSSMAMLRHISMDWWTIRKLLRWQNTTPQSNLYSRGT